MGQGDLLHYTLDGNANNKQCETSCKHFINHNLLDNYFLNQRRRDYAKSMHMLFDPPAPLSHYFPFCSNVELCLRPLTITCKENRDYTKALVIKGKALTRMQCPS